MRRVLAIALALVGLAAGVTHFFKYDTILTSPEGEQVGYFEFQVRLSEKSELPPSPLLDAAAQRHMFALGILLAAAIAVALALRPGSGGTGGLLRDTLALGAASLGYAMVLHPMLGLPPPWSSVLAALANAAMFLSLWMFARFAATYPSPIVEDDLNIGEWEWEWARMARRRRERGISWARVILEDFTRLDPRRLSQFLDTPEAPSRDQPSAYLVDASLHRAVQGKAWLATLCLVPAVATLMFLSPQKLTSVIGVTLMMIWWVMIPAFLYYPLCMGYWQHNYIKADTQERRAIRWWLVSIYVSVVIYLSFGIATMAFGVATGFFAQFESWVVVFLGMMYWLFPGAWFMLLVAIAASIFLRGAVEPSLILSRAVLYGLIVLLMTVTFVTVESILQTQIIATFGLPDQVGIVVTGTVVALLLGPLRNRVEARISNWVAKVLPDEVS